MGSLARLLGRLPASNTHKKISLKCRVPWEIEKQDKNQRILIWNKEGKKKPSALQTWRRKEIYVRYLPVWDKKSIFFSTLPLLHVTTDSEKHSKLLFIAHWFSAPPHIVLLCAWSDVQRTIHSVVSWAWRENIHSSLSIHCIGPCFTHQSNMVA